MEVKNETVKYYRFIDMTAICEAVFEFLEETIQTELPMELEFIINYDKIKKDLLSIVDLPDSKVDQFIKFCIQNKGRLSPTKRQKFFSALHDDEIERLEEVIRGYPDMRL